MKRPTTISVIALCLLTGVGGGCALFEEEATITAEKTPLKQVSPSVDAIQLDVIFVERPISDPLLGKRLWSHLDQIITVPAPTLAATERNGFRFGVSPSNPSHALQAALGMTGDIVARDDDHQFRKNGRRYARRSGEELEIDTWSTYPQCDVSFDRNGEAGIASYTNARCVYRVRVERTQDGWARLEFTPEIHHGDLKLRSVVDEFAWTTTPSQQIDRQYDQQFEVELNLGEMVVLGADGDDPKSLGHHFFRGGDTDNKLQRLLIIRLADMQRVDPIYE